MRVIAAITFIALAIALVSVVLKTYTPVPVKPTEDDGSSDFGDDVYFPVTDDMTYAKVRVS